MARYAGIIAVGMAALAQATLADPGTQIWHGGPIITMDGPRAVTVQAVVTRGGRIVFVGSERQARRVAGASAIDRDLKGRTMLPGFIDAHSHFAMALQSAGGIDLGDLNPATVRDVPALLATLKHQVAERTLPEDAWVVVWNYNEEALTERRHVTRAELDAALPGRKVVLLHVSLHGMVMNSPALAAAKIDETTPVPAGGVVTRDDTGRLTGVLFETAAQAGFAALPRPTAEQKLAMLDAAQQRYARAGFTHAQDGATTPPDLAFFTSPAARQRIRIDLALLPHQAMVPDLLKRSDLRFGTYQDHVKLQGVKFILDGSPQARTAFMTRDYARGAPDGHHPWHGQPVQSEADFLDAARKVNLRGWQIFVHANGDAAIDMAIRTFDKLGITAAQNRRPIVIHSQFQRPDQLPAYRRIGVGPAYFTNHTYYFADTHRSNFPGAVVDFISPIKAARAAGLHPSNHSDFPVTRLSPLDQLWTSMARTSLTGVLSGADQRVSAYQGLQALTTDAAWQVFEENRKGRIKPGLLADFVMLDTNPLTAPLDKVRTIKVLETVKEGETVWAQRSEK